MEEKQRETFIFYRSFWEAVKELKPLERENVLSGVLKYMFEGEEPNLKGIAKSIWILIKPQLDANIKKYNNGNKGGRPSKNSNLNETETKPKVIENEKPNNNLNETETKPTHNPMKKEEGIMNNEEGIMNNEEGIMNNDKCRMNNDECLIKNEECIKDSFLETKVNKINNFDSELFETFEQELMRPLSQYEVQLIGQWQEKYDEQEIIFALREMLIRNIKNNEFNYINRILENRSSGERKDD